MISPFSMFLINSNPFPPQKLKKFISFTVETNKNYMDEETYKFKLKYIGINDIMCMHQYFKTEINIKDIKKIFNQMFKDII